MRRGPDRGAPALQMPRSRDGTPRPPPASFSWETSFEITNTPHLVTLLRWIGLGFTPRPYNNLEKEEDDEEMEDLDVGTVGQLLLDLDI